MQRAQNYHIAESSPFPRDIHKRLFSSTANSTPDRLAGDSGGTAWYFSVLTRYTLWVYEFSRGLRFILAKHRILV
jgi:hypothetical protein